MISFIRNIITDIYMETILIKVFKLVVQFSRMTEMKDNGIIAFVGPDKECRAEALVAAAWNLPILTYVSYFYVSFLSTYIARHLNRRKLKCTKISKHRMAENSIHYKHFANFFSLFRRLYQLILPSFLSLFLCLRLSPLPLP